MKKTSNTKNILSSKTIVILLWSAIFAVLLILLQHKEKFHFFFIEQSQLFLYDNSYIQGLLNKPGGLVQLLSEYFIQFFYRPYCGALITSALLTIIGIQTYYIIKAIAPHSGIILLSILPIASFLFIIFDINYYYKGTFAYCITLLAIYLHIRIKNFKIRLIYDILIASLLLWTTGPTAVLFSICILIIEIFTAFRKSYLFAIPLLITISESFICVHNSWIGEFRFILLPDGYFAARLHPSKAIYASWICIAAIIFASCLLRNKKWTGTKSYIIVNVICLIVAAIYSYGGIKKYVNSKSDFFKELDFYMRNEQWDTIITRCSKEKMNNFLYKCCANIALAEKGMLLDNIFNFKQLGWQGIYPEWNKVPHVSLLLSDEYYSMGEIALSQRMAFEANESYESSCPRALKRLIQTNIIYGRYPIAEKYIVRLEKSKYYRQWAHDQRKFLDNESAISNDPSLSSKRKSIISENKFAGIDGIISDLFHIAEQNPTNKTAIQYAGAMLLLTKDTESIRLMIEKYYKTDVLPSLPKALQEAIFTYAEMSPEIWNKYNIQRPIIERYKEYRHLFAEAKKYNSIETYNLIQKNYGDTYWFYFMFNKAN